MVAGIADRIIVMYAGTIVERGLVEEVFADTRHPYTLGLLQSLPRMDRRSQRAHFHRGLAAGHAQPDQRLSLCAALPRSY